MAFTSSLSDWALRNCEALDLRATRLSWVDEWCPKLIDFIVTIVADGEMFEGRGMAESEELAFTKAVAEALERCVMRHSGVYSSNGLAVHSTVECAREGAQGELIERDAFFCHWLTKKPFERILDIQGSTLDIGGAPLAEINDRIARLGIDLKIAEMQSVRPYSAFICVASGINAPRPFGLHLGMGSHIDPSEAIKHAVVEWLRTTVAWCSPAYSGKSAITRSEFEANPLKGPQQHELLAFSMESLGKLDHLLPMQGNLAAHSPILSVQDADIQFRILEKPALIIDAPIIAVHAHSRFLQDAFFGYPKPERLNLPRLSQFAGSDLKLADLMSEPHPLG